MVSNSFQLGNLKLDDHASGVGNENHSPSCDDPDSTTCKTKQVETEEPKKQSKSRPKQTSDIDKLQKEQRQKKKAERRRLRQERRRRRKQRQRQQRLRERLRVDPDDVVVMQLRSGSSEPRRRGSPQISFKPSILSEEEEEEATAGEVIIPSADTATPKSSKPSPDTARTPKHLPEGRVMTSKPKLSQRRKRKNDSKQKRIHDDDEYDDEQ